MNGLSRPAALVDVGDINFLEMEDDDSHFPTYAAAPSIEGAPAADDVAEV